MLNFCEQFLIDDKKCHIIRFNPWMVSNSEELLKSLIEEIYEVIDGNFSKAKKNFKEYALKLMPTLGKVGAYLGAISSGVDPKSSQVISQAAGKSLIGMNDIYFGNPLSKQKQKVIDEFTSYRYIQNKDSKSVPELVSRTNDLIRACYPDIREGNVTRTNK